MGFANDFNMDPIWVYIWYRNSTYLGLQGSHACHHYGSHVGFANDVGMGPTLVQIGDLHGSYLGQIVPLSIVGPMWVLQITLAWIPHGFR